MNIQVIDGDKIAAARRRLTKEFKDCGSLTELNEILDIPAVAVAAGDNVTAPCWYDVVRGISALRALRGLEGDEAPDGITLMSEISGMTLYVERQITVGSGNYPFHVCASYKIATPTNQILANWKKHLNEQVTTLLAELD